MIPVIQILRRNPLRTGSRMPHFKIFILEQSRVTKINGKTLPITQVDALPEGVGAERSDYKEVSTKFPGSWSSSKQ